MYKYSYFVVIGLFGLGLVMASQIAVLGKHYSNLWGDMWAIVCFTGLAAISAAASLAIFKYVNSLRRTFFNSVLRIQAIGTILITGLAVVYCLQSVISRSNVLTMGDGDGRRGVFFAWFGLVALFTLANLFLSVFRALIVKIKKEKVEWF